MKAPPPPAPATEPLSTESKNETPNSPRLSALVTSILDDHENEGEGMIISSRQDGVGPVAFKIADREILVDRRLLAKIIQIHAN